MKVSSRASDKKSQSRLLHFQDILSNDRISSIEKEMQKPQYKPPPVQKSKIVEK